MNLIRLAIERPIAVVAAVLMVVMFGLVALRTIPIQLSPDVNRPVITVTTLWTGAAPAEIEREILNRQEEEMAGLEALQSVIGRAEPGRSRLILRRRSCGDATICINRTIGPVVSLRRVSMTRAFLSRGKKIDKTLALSMFSMTSSTP